MAKYNELQESAETFMMRDRDHKSVEPGGNEVIAVLYGCKPTADLDFECASRINEKVVSNSAYLPPERLPLTSDAARFHSRRVYHQVHEWTWNSFDATELGWDRRNIQHGTVLKPHIMG